MHIDNGEDYKCSKGGGKPLMYPSLTLDDETEIVHSQTLPDGKVKVLEFSQMGGFANASDF